MNQCTLRVAAILKGSAFPPGTAPTCSNLQCHSSVKLQFSEGSQKLSRHPTFNTEKNYNALP